MTTDPTTNQPLPETIQEGTDVFISYSRKDIDFVRWLNGQFQEAGRKAWIDWAGIQPDEGMVACHPAAPSMRRTPSCRCLEPGLGRLGPCRNEVDRAVSSGKRIVPVVCRDVEGVVVHPELAKLQYIFLRTEEERRENLAKVFQALDTDLAHVRAHTRFLIRAREWEAAGRTEGKLLRGADLVEADQWLSTVAGKLPVPAPLHSDHILASKAHERAQIDRQRRLIGRAFVKPARQAMDSGLHDHALRLAAAGALLAEDVEWKLVPELRRPSARGDLPEPGGGRFGHRGAVIVAAFSPDGARIVTASS